MDRVPLPYVGGYIQHHPGQQCGALNNDEAPGTGDGGLGIQYALAEREFRQFRGRLFVSRMA